MLVNSLADSSVLLQQGLSRVLIMPKVLAGDQAVGVLQPGHEVVRLRGELKKVERLLQMVEALRSLVLQPLPLALHIHDALLDPHRAEAFVTQDLFSSLYGVLEKTGGVTQNYFTLFSGKWNTYFKGRSVLFVAPICMRF